jgi:hypothetical protein
VFAADDNEVGQIKLYGNQTFCVDVYYGRMNVPLHVIECIAPIPINRDFRVLPDLPGIQWAGGDATTLFTRAGNAVVLAPPRPASQRWTSVNPMIKLLELDAGNVCAETPTDESGNRVVGLQLFAAKCDLGNINQQFIMHPNGFIEVNHGSLQSNEHGGLCLGVLDGSLKQGAAFVTMPCSSTRAPVPPNLVFTVDTDSARIRWTAHAQRVVGIDTATTKLGFYLDTYGDPTQKWQPSLGDAAVMIKSVDNDLCLDRSFRAQPCAVEPSNTCSRDADASSTNADDQSFVLHNGDATRFAIIAADGGNHCASVGAAEGSAVQVEWCDYLTNHWFRVNAAQQSIVSTSSNLVFTLESDVMETGTRTVMKSPTGRESQRWDVLPVRQTKCARHCLQDGSDGSCPSGLIDGGACYASACVEGLCGGEEGVYGKKAVCCGEHGIDRHCLNARANLGNGITAGNWCMECTGTDEHDGLTGCSTPKALPGNGQLPTTGTHLRCSFDNANDDNVDATLNSNQDLNTDLEYLAITGAVAKVGPSDLHESFPNLKHLDMAGSGASGVLLDSAAVASWTQLEYLNVSECTKICLHTSCFDLDLNVMTSLRVLDMSSVGLADETKLESLKTLTSLQELYLNDNGLESLPDNFFDNMLILTKLRVLGNQIQTTLPSEIYTRVANFDCDVASGNIPAQRTASPTGPTKSPTVKQPTANPVNPSSTPSKSPTTAAEPNAPTSTPVEKPSEVTAAEGDNTLVFALAGVAVVVVAIVIAVVVMMKKKAAAGGDVVRIRSLVVAEVVSDKFPGMSDQYL